MLRCSAVVLEEYNGWKSKVRSELNGMQRGSKLWWAKERQLQLQRQKSNSIPALKDDGGNWVRDSEEKANLLAGALTSKFELPVVELNSYSDILSVPLHWESATQAGPTISNVSKSLETLDDKSATGPDLLPARILRQCAASLALPIFLLAQAILQNGVWPDFWREHWMIPLHKRQSTYNPANYRGVHMTAQLAKVIERALLPIFRSTLSSEPSIGPNQFAYCQERGSRDALAFLVMS